MVKSPIFENSPFSGTDSGKSFFSIVSGKIGLKSNNGALQNRYMRISNPSLFYLIQYIFSAMFETILQRGRQKKRNNDERYFFQGFEQTIRST